MKVKKQLQAVLIIVAVLILLVCSINVVYTNLNMVKINRVVLGNPGPTANLSLPGFLSDLTSNYLKYQAQTANGNLGEAEKLIELISKSDDYKKLQLTRIGLLYLKKKDFGNAIRICRQIQTSLLIESIAEAGSQAYDAQRWLDVIRIYSFRLELEPQNRSIYRVLIAAYKGVNDLKSVIQEAVSLVTYAKPVLLQDYQDLSYLYENQGDYEEAVYWWTVAWLKFPDSESPLERLMWDSYTLQSDNKIIQMYADRLVANFPQMAKALYNAAHIYYFLGLTEKADSLARQAVSLSPDDSEAHFILGLILTKMDSGEAESELKVSINLNRDQFWAWIVLGDLIASNNPQQAVHDYQAALNIKNITNDQKAVVLDRLRKYNLP
jgi:tetratricopeptide (TPR) repeat protein